MKAALHVLSTLLLSATCMAVSAEPAPIEIGDVPGEVAIHYQVHGAKSAPPVLVIHHFGGRFDTSQLAQLIVLLGDYRLIGMDVRGHGKSGHPSEPKDYGLMLVEDVNRLLNHLRVDDAHIIGLSMGGIIGLKFASLYPARVRSLTLVGQGLVPAQNFETWVAMGQAVMNSKARSPEQEANLHIYSGLLTGYPPLQVTEFDAGNLKIPLLVVIGEDDERLDSARHLKQVYAATTLIVAPGYNHGTILAKDSPFYLTIDGFLRQQESR